MSGAPAVATSCEHNAVFLFSQALYLEDYIKADTLLAEIARDRDEEIGEYLRQVLHFMRAYHREEQKEMELALQKIELQVKSLAESVAQNPDPKKRLILANITLHTARLLLAQDRLLSAVSMAREGKAWLDQALLELPGHPNGLLVDGLYRYYAELGHEEFVWLKFALPLDKGQKNGIKQIQQALAYSPDHAFEALRSLLYDIRWNRQHTCRYLPMISDIETGGIPAFSYRQQLVAAMLFCGFNKQAQAQLSGMEAALEADKLKPEQREWLFLAQLHSLAANGGVDTLIKILEGSQRRKAIENWQINFALARAYDVQGERNQAIKLYEHLLGEAPNQNYRSMLKAYIRLPYRPAVPFDMGSVPVPEFACAVED